MMVNFLSPTSLLTFDECSLLSRDGELAVPDFFAHLWCMFAPLTWWWTCCPRLLCSPLMHVHCSHLMVDLLSPTYYSPLIHVRSTHLMVSYLSLSSLLTFDACSLLSSDGELAVPDIFAHLWHMFAPLTWCWSCNPDIFAQLWYMFAPLTGWWTCFPRLLCSPVIHVCSSHLMVNLLSPISLLTCDTCLLLSPDGELAVPDFFAHLWYIFTPHLVVNLSPTSLLTFDTCLLLSPYDELAVPDFFAHLWYIFASLTGTAKLGPIGSEYITPARELFLKNIKIKIRQTYIEKWSFKFCFGNMCVCFIYVKCLEI